MTATSPILPSAPMRYTATAALAALELSHCGLNIMNAITREEVLGPSSLPLTLTFPTLPEPSQCRAMSLEDIGEVRAWHAQAVRRGISAGFDIIYVYASLVLSLPAQFLSTRYNKRTDRYGGSLINRVRLLRELIEDTVDAVQGRCAVATRVTLDELLESPLDGRCELEEFFSIVGELPDLWDVVVGGYGNDAGSAQFGSGALSTEVVRRVKGLTTKPVVSVGCFTSPDTMADLVRDGVLDLIGAARPSIADPFLPRKVADGQAGTNCQMRRLQPLCGQRLFQCAHTLSAKPHGGRRTAPKLASGAYPPDCLAPAMPGGRRGRGGTGVREAAFGRRMRCHATGREGSARRTRYA